MNGREKIILQGGGDHARVVLDCLLDQDMQVIALFDPKYAGDLFGVPQRGKYDPEFSPDAKAVIAIGDNQIRKTVAELSAHAFTTAVHRSALVSKFSSIGEGSMILHRAVVQAKARVGKHVIINTAAQVDHDCVIEDYVHIAPGAILCGTVTIGEGSFIGAGAVVIPGIQIGKWATVGAGAVVINDLPDFALAVGNPAKVIKHVLR
jgi:sugar O-acyltransferase (sialic acid O-acetyltransferase NeuD family)